MILSFNTVFGTVVIFTIGMITLMGMMMTIVFFRFILRGGVSGPWYPGRRSLAPGASFPPSSSFPQNAVGAPGLIPDAAPFAGTTSDNSGPAGFVNRDSGAGGANFGGASAVGDTSAGGSAASVNTGSGGGIVDSGGAAGGTDF